MLLKTTARRILDLSGLIDEMDDGIAAMLEQLFPGQVSHLFPDSAMSRRRPFSPKSVTSPDSRTKPTS